MVKHNILFFDLEGTLTISYWRNHWAQKDWSKFESLMKYDPVNEEMAGIARNAFDSHKIIILTGKMVRGYRDAAEWLNRHQIKYDWIQMRRNDDLRPSYEYKASYLAEFDKDRIMMVFDDREDIINHLKSLGYPTCLITK